MSIILPWQSNSPYSYLRARIPSRPTVPKLHWGTLRIAMNSLESCRIVKNFGKHKTSVGHYVDKWLQVSAEFHIRSHCIPSKGVLSLWSWIFRACVLKSKYHSTINLEQEQGWGCPIWFQSWRSCIVPNFINACNLVCSCGYFGIKSNIYFFIFCCYALKWLLSCWDIMIKLFESVY